MEKFRINESDYKYDHRGFAIEFDSREDAVEFYKKCDKNHSYMYENPQDGTWVVSQYARFLTVAEKEDC